MSTDALKLAASVLKGSQEYKRGHTTFVEAVEEIEAALAQPQPEPVAWVRWEWNRSGLKSLVFEKPEELSLAETATGVVYDPLYTSPPARKPLTEEEIDKATYKSPVWDEGRIYARAIEAAHGIKGDA